MRSGIPNSEGTQLVSGWAMQLSPELGDLDERIAAIEANNLARHYTAPTWNAWAFYTSPGRKGFFVSWEVK